MKLYKKHVQPNQYAEVLIDAAGAVLCVVAYNTTGSGDTSSIQTCLPAVGDIFDPRGWRSGNTDAFLRTARFEFEQFGSGEMPAFLIAE